MYLTIKQAKNIEYRGGSIVITLKGGDAVQLDMCDIMEIEDDVINSCGAYSVQFGEDKKLSKERDIIRLARKYNKGEQNGHNDLEDWPLG